ncbi:MAG: hypothetical protein MK297_12030 [Planctomycetes bacterium]|nr:hypothetical protein [Planctomycetota bacterium]
MKISMAAVVSSLLLVGCETTSRGELLLDDAAGVEVQLVSLAGEPLSGVPVKLMVDRWASPTPLGASREVRTGVTGLAGEFVFGYRERAGTSLALDEGDTSSLWADAGDGWQLLSVISLEGWGGDSTPTELQLTPREFEFRFEVNDVEGRPLEGATLQLVAGPFGAPVDHLPARRTDATGRLDWTGFAGGGWWVDISSPGFAPVRTCPYQFKSSDDPERCYVVTMRPGREVTVEVLDLSGKPAVSARVFYTYENIGLPTFSTWTDTTDDRGRVGITVPSDGEFEVEAVDFTGAGAGGRELTVRVRTEEAAVTRGSI